MQSHLMSLPTVEALITLRAITEFGQLRLDFYGPTWIIRSFSVYDPKLRLKGDPYKYLWGLPVLILSPQIDKPQLRKIGFPIDRDFYWNYVFNTVKN